MPERYRLGRLVKRGGMAEVFEATIRGLDGFERKVAIKRLLIDFCQDQALRATFIDEARILSRLNSANIVSILDYGLMDDRPFQALEFIDGSDLTELKTILDSRGQGFSAEIALHIAVEVAHALEHAHRATDDAGRPLGIVHRDVGPSNILASWNGDVKLSDFGVAFAEDRIARTQVGMAKGTITFMAPEQARGSGIGPRTDIYALGLVLHWMVSGSNPLEDDDLRMSVHAGERFPVTSSVPTDIAQIIERATRFRPNERYDSASSLASDCWRALHGRLTTDARQLMKAWVSSLRPDRPSAQHPVADLFDLELIRAPSQDALPRYASVPSQTRIIRGGQGTLGASLPPTEGPNDLGEEVPTTLSPTPIYGRGPTSARAAVLSADEESTRVPRSAGTRDPSPPAKAKGRVDPAIGTTINGFRLVEQIGQGGWSRVFRAVSEDLGLEVAVKLARDELSEVGVKRFRREAEILCRLQHPNIVHVIDCGATDANLPFLTMELLRGRSLKEIIDSEAPLDPRRAADIARQIAAGLAEAHGNGLVHRDLKPGNVMVVWNGQEEEAKILDFGIARAFDGDTMRARLTESGNFLGTPAYVSPEQIQSPSTVEPSSDLYSLGVVSYRMLSGHLPFDGSAADMITAHLKSKPEPLPEHGEMGRLVLQLLEKTPSKRPRSALEVVERLTSILLKPLPSRAKATGSAVLGRGIRPESITPIVRSAIAGSVLPPQRREWWPWALVTVAAIAVAAVLALMALRETKVPAGASTPASGGERSSEHRTSALLEEKAHP